MGILMDLGVSSPQLDRPERGFSYRFDAPLDMRMDAKQSLTAADVVNGYGEAQLATVISQYGEERFARRIAHAIVAARPLDSTRALADIVRDAIPAATRRRGPHPARRTFQAIRMEVNRELPNLAEGLQESVHVVGPRGRVLVLAYHSLEDRMVKTTFARWAGVDRDVYEPPKLPVPLPKRHTLMRVLTRRPLRPRADEVAANPRAESARLRAVERLDVPGGPDPRRSLPTSSREHPHGRGSRRSFPHGGRDRPTPSRHAITCGSRPTPAGGDCGRGC